MSEIERLLLDRVKALENRLEGFMKLQVDLRINGVVKPTTILARPEGPRPEVVFTGEKTIAVNFRGNQIK